MLYSTFLTFTVAAVLSLQQVAAIPLDVKMGDGNKENRKKIESAMPLVDQKIKNMKAVIDLPDAQAKAHPAVVKAFGRNANVAEIRKNVHTLHESKIMVPHTDDAKGVTQGATNPANGYVVFGSSFYSSDANTRAGTIIHEASHAKAKTVDHFKKDGTPGTKSDPGVRVGYKDSHMSELNAKHSNQMHHNADGYRVFGDECPNVRRSLYRRAMEESHPVARSELLRRAAHACAWRPKGHVAAPGTNNHLQAKVHGAQKSASSKKPLTNAGGSAKSAHKVAAKKSPLGGGAKRLTKVNTGKKSVAHDGNHEVSKKVVANKAHTKGNSKALRKTQPAPKTKPVHKASASKPAPRRVNGKKH